MRAISALDPDMDRHLADFNDSYRWETTIWDLGEVDTLWVLGEGESDDDDSDSSDGSDSLAGSGSSDDARTVSGSVSGPGSGPGHSAGPASPRPSSPGSDAGSLPSEAEFEGMPQDALERGDEYLRDHDGAGMDVARSVLGERPVPAADRGPAPRVQESLWDRVTAAVAANYEEAVWAEAARLGLPDALSRLDGLGSPDEQGRLAGQAQVTESAVLRDLGLDRADIGVALARIEERAGTGYVDELRYLANELLLSELEGAVEARVRAPSLWDTVVSGVVAAMTVLPIEEEARALRRAFTAVRDADGPLQDLMREFWAERRAMSSRSTSEPSAESQSPEQIESLRRAAVVLLGEMPDTVAGVGPDAAVQRLMYAELVTLLAAELSRRNWRDAWHAVEPLREAAERARTWTRNGPVPAPDGEGWNVPESVAVSRWQSVALDAITRDRQDYFEWYQRRWRRYVKSGTQELAGMAEEKRDRVLAEAQDLLLAAEPLLASSAVPPGSAWDEAGDPTPGAAWRLADGTLVPVRVRRLDPYRQPELVWAVGKQGESRLPVGLAGEDRVKLLSTMMKALAPAIGQRMDARKSEERITAQINFRIDLLLNSMPGLPGTGFRDLVQNHPGTVGQGENRRPAQNRGWAGPTGRVYHTQRRRLTEKALELLGTTSAQVSLAPPLEARAWDVMARALLPLVAQRDQIRFDMSGMERLINDTVRRLLTDAVRLMDHRAGSGTAAEFERYLAPQRDGLPEYLAAYHALAPGYQESAAEISTGTLADRARAATRSLERDPAGAVWRSRARAMLQWWPLEFANARRARRAADWHGWAVELVGEAGRSGGVKGAEEALARLSLDALDAGVLSVHEPRVVGWFARALRGMSAGDALFWRYRVLGRVVPPVTASREELWRLEPAHQVYLDALAFIASQDRYRQVHAQVAAFVPAWIADPEAVVSQVPATDPQSRDAAQRALAGLFETAIDNAPEEGSAAVPVHPGGSGAWLWQFGVVRESLNGHPREASVWRARARQLLSVRPLAEGDPAAGLSARLYAGLVDRVAEAGRVSGEAAAEEMLARLWVDVVAAGADWYLEGTPEPRVVGWLASALRALPVAEQERWRREVVEWVRPPEVASAEELVRLAPAHQAYLDALAFVASQEGSGGSSLVARFAPVRIEDPEEVAAQVPGVAPESRDTAQRALDALFADAVAARRVGSSGDADLVAMNDLLVDDIRVSDVDWVPLGSGGGSFGMAFPLDGDEEKVMRRYVPDPGEDRYSVVAHRGEAGYRVKAKGRVVVLDNAALGRLFAGLGVLAAQGAQAGVVLVTCPRWARPEIGVLESKVRELGYRGPVGLRGAGPRAELLPDGRVRDLAEDGTPTPGGVVLGDRARGSRTRKARGSVRSGDNGGEGSSRTGAGSKRDAGAVGRSAAGAHKRTRSGVAAGPEGGGAGTAEPASSSGGAAEPAAAEASAIEFRQVWRADAKPGKAGPNTVAGDAALAAAIDALAVRLIESDRDGLASPPVRAAFHGKASSLTGGIHEAWQEFFAGRIDAALETKGSALTVAGLGLVVDLVRRASGNVQSPWVELLVDGNPGEPIDRLRAASSVVMELNPEARVQRVWSSSWARLVRAVEGAGYEALAVLASGGDPRLGEVSAVAMRSNGLTAEAKAQMEGQLGAKVRWGLERVLAAAREGRGLPGGLSADQLPTVDEMMPSVRLSVRATRKARAAGRAVPDERVTVALSRNDPPGEADPDAEARALEEFFAGMAGMSLLDSSPADQGPSADRTGAGSGLWEGEVKYQAVRVADTAIASLRTAAGRIADLVVDARGKGLEAPVVRAVFYGPATQLHHSMPADWRTVLTELVDQALAERSPGLSAAAAGLVIELAKAEGKDHPGPARLVLEAETGSAKPVAGLRVASPVILEVLSSTSMEVRGLSLGRVFWRSEGAGAETLEAFAAGDAEEARMPALTVTVIRNYDLTDKKRAALIALAGAQVRMGAARALAAARARAERDPSWLSADRLPSLDDFVSEIETKFVHHWSKAEMHAEFAEVPGSSDAAPAADRERAVEAFFGAARDAGLTDTALAEAGAIAGRSDTEPAKAVLKSFPSEEPGAAARNAAAVARDPVAIAAHAAAMAEPEVVWQEVWRATAQPIKSGMKSVADNEELAAAIDALADELIEREQEQRELPLVSVVCYAANGVLLNADLRWRGWVEGMIDAALVRKGHPRLSVAGLGLWVDLRRVPQDDGPSQMALEVGEAPRELLAARRTTTSVPLGRAPGTQIRMSAFAWVRLLRRGEGAAVEGLAALSETGDARMSPVKVTITRGEPFPAAREAEVEAHFRNEVLGQMRWSAERVLSAARVKAARGDLGPDRSASWLPSVEDMLPEVHIQFEVVPGVGRTGVLADIPLREGTPARVVEGFFAGLAPKDLLGGRRPGLPKVVRRGLPGAKAAGLDPAADRLAGEFEVRYREDGGPWLGEDTVARVRAFAVRWAARMKEFALQEKEFPQTRLHVDQRGGTAADGARLFAEVEGILMDEAGRLLREIRAGLGRPAVTLADLGLGITRGWRQSRRTSETNIDNDVEAASFRIATFAASGLTHADLAELRETPLYTGYGAGIRSELTPFELFRVRRMASGFARRLYRDGQMDRLVLEQKAGAAANWATSRRRIAVLRVVEEEVREAYREFGRRVPSSVRVPVATVMRDHVRFATTVFEGPGSARMLVVSPDVPGSPEAAPDAPGSPETAPDAPGSPEAPDEQPLALDDAEFEELLRAGLAAGGGMAEEDRDVGMSGTDAPALAPYWEGQELDWDVVHGTGADSSAELFGPADRVSYEEFLADELPVDEFLAGTEDLYGADGFEWDQWDMPGDPLAEPGRLGDEPADEPGVHGLAELLAGREWRGAQTVETEVDGAGVVRVVKVDLTDGAGVVRGVFFPAWQEVVSGRAQKAAEWFRRFVPGGADFTVALHPFTDVWGSATGYAVTDVSSGAPVSVDVREQGVFALKDAADTMSLAAQGTRPLVLLAMCGAVQGEEPLLARLQRFADGPGGGERVAGVSGLLKLGPRGWRSQPRGPVLETRPDGGLAGSAVRLPGPPDDGMSFEDEDGVTLGDDRVAGGGGGKREAGAAGPSEDESPIPRSPSDDGTLASESSEEEGLLPEEALVRSLFGPLAEGGRSELAGRVMTAHAEALREWAGAPLGEGEGRAEFERIWGGSVLAGLRAELQEEVDVERVRSGQAPPRASENAAAAMRDWSVWRLDLARVAESVSPMSGQELARMTDIMLPGMVPADSADVFSAGEARLLADLMSVVAARYPERLADPAEARQLAGRMWEEFSALGREADFPASVALDRAFASRWTEAYELSSHDIGLASAETEAWQAATEVVRAALGSDAASKSAGMLISLHAVEADNWLLTYGEDDDAQRADRFEAWWSKPELVEMREAWEVALPFAPASTLRMFHELFPMWRLYLDGTARNLLPGTVVPAAPLRAKASDALGTPVELKGQAMLLQMRLRQALLDRIAYHEALRSEAEARGDGARSAVEKDDIDAAQRASRELVRDADRIRTLQEQGHEFEDELEDELAAWQERVRQAERARIVPRLVLRTLAHPQRARIRELLIGELAGLAPGPYSPVEDRLIDDAVGVFSAACGQKDALPPSIEGAAWRFAAEFAALRQAGDPPPELARVLAERAAHAQHQRAEKAGTPSPFGTSDDFLPPAPRRDWPSQTADRTDKIERVRKRAGDRLSVWLGQLSADAVAEQLGRAETVFGSVEGLRGLPRDFAEEVLLAHMAVVDAERRHSPSALIQQFLIENAWADPFLTDLRTVAGQTLGPDLAATDLAIETSRWIWRHEIEAARAEAAVAAAQWRRDAAHQALGWPLGMIGEGVETAAAARARALYEELVDAVAAGTWLRKERPGWERSQYQAQWTAWLMAGFKGLLSARAFEASEDQRVSDFRARVAGDFRQRFGAEPPAPGQGVTAEKMRQAWVMRGRKLLGNGLFAGRHGAELDHLDELALVAGRYDAGVSTVRARAESAAREWAQAGQAAVQPDRLRLEREALRLADRMLGEAGRSAVDAGRLGRVARAVSESTAAAQWLARVAGEEGSGAGLAKQIKLARARLWPAELTAAADDQATSGSMPDQALQAQWIAEGERVLGDLEMAELLTPWRYWLASRLDDLPGADWLLTVLAQLPDALSEAVAALEALEAASTGTEEDVELSQFWEATGQRAAGGGLSRGAARLTGYRAVHYLASARPAEMVEKLADAASRLRKGRFDPPPKRVITMLNPPPAEDLPELADSYRWNSTVWDLQAESDDDDDFDLGLANSESDLSVDESTSSDDSGSLAGSADGSGSDPRNSARPASPESIRSEASDYSAAPAQSQTDDEYAGIPQATLELGDDYLRAGGGAGMDVARSVLGPRPVPMPDRGPAPQEQERLWDRLAAAVADRFEDAIMEASERLGLEDALATVGGPGLSDKHGRPRGRTPAEEFEMLRALGLDGRATSAALERLVERESPEYVLELRHAANEVLLSGFEHASAVRVMSPSVWEAVVSGVVAEMDVHSIEEQARALRRGFDAVHTADGPLQELVRKFEADRDLIEASKTALSEVEAQQGLELAAGLRHAAVALLGEMPDVIPGVGADAATQRKMYSDLVAVVGARLAAGDSRDSAWRFSEEVRAAAERVRTWTRNGPVPTPPGEGWDVSEAVAQSRWASVGFARIAEDLLGRFHIQRSRWRKRIARREAELRGVAEETRDRALAEARSMLLAAEPRLAGAAVAPSLPWDRKGNPVPGVAWRLTDGTLAPVLARGLDPHLPPLAWADEAGEDTGSAGLLERPKPPAWPWDRDGNPVPGVAWRLADGTLAPVLARGLDPHQPPETVWALGERGESRLPVGLDGENLEQLLSDMAKMIQRGVVQLMNARETEERLTAEIDERVRQLLEGRDGQRGTGFRDIDLTDKADVARFEQEWQAERSDFPDVASRLSEDEQDELVDQALGLLGTTRSAAENATPLAAQAWIGTAAALAPLLAKRNQIRFDQRGMTSSTAGTVSKLLRDAAPLLDHRAGSGTEAEFVRYLFARHSGLPEYVETERSRVPGYRESVAGVSSGALADRAGAAGRLLDGDPVRAAVWRSRARGMLGWWPLEFGDRRQAALAAQWHGWAVELVAEAGRSAGEKGAEEALARLSLDALDAGVLSVHEPRVVGWFARALRVLPAEDALFWRFRVLGRVMPPAAAREEFWRLEPAYQVYLDALAFIASQDRYQQVHAQVAAFVPARIADPDAIAAEVPATHPGSRDAAQWALAGAMSDLLVGDVRVGDVDWVPLGLAGASYGMAFPLDEDERKAMRRYVPGPGEVRYSVVLHRGRAGYRVKAKGRVVVLDEAGLGKLLVGLGAMAGQRAQEGVVLVTCPGWARSGMGALESSVRELGYDGPVGLYGTGLRAELLPSGQVRDLAVDDTPTPGSIVLGDNPAGSGTTRAAAGAGGEGSARLGGGPKRDASTLGDSAGAGVHKRSRTDAVRGDGGVGAARLADVGAGGLRQMWRAEAKPGKKGSNAVAGDERLARKIDVLADELIERDEQGRESPPVRAVFHAKESSLTRGVQEEWRTFFEGRIDAALKAKGSGLRVAGLGVAVDLVRRASADVAEPWVELLAGDGPGERIAGLRAASSVVMEMELESRVGRVWSSSWARLIRAVEGAGYEALAALAAGGDPRLPDISAVAVRSNGMTAEVKTQLQGQLETRVRWGLERVLAAAREAIRAGRPLPGGLSADRLPSVEQMMPTAQITAKFISKARAKAGEVVDGARVTVALPWRGAPRTAVPAADGRALEEFFAGVAGMGLLEGTASAAAAQQRRQAARTAGGSVVWEGKVKLGTASVVGKDRAGSRSAADRIAGMVIDARGKGREAPVLRAVFHGTQNQLKHLMAGSWREALTELTELLDAALRERSPGLTAGSAGLVIDLVKAEEKGREGPLRLTVEAEAGPGERVAGLRVSSRVALETVSDVTMQVRGLSLGRMMWRSEGAGAEVLEAFAAGRVGEARMPALTVMVVRRNDLPEKRREALAAEVGRQVRLGAARALAAARARAEQDPSWLSADRLPSLEAFVPEVRLDFVPVKAKAATWAEFAELPGAGGAEEGVVSVADREQAVAAFFAAARAAGLTDAMLAEAGADPARAGLTSFTPGEPVIRDEVMRRDERRELWRAEAEPTKAGVKSVAGSAELTKAIGALAAELIERDEQGRESPPVSLVCHGTGAVVKKAVEAWQDLVEEMLDVALAAKGRPGLSVAGLGLWVELRRELRGGASEMGLEVGEGRRELLADLRMVPSAPLRLVPGNLIRVSAFSWARLLRRGEGAAAEALAAFAAGGTARMEPVTVTVTVTRSAQSAVRVAGVEAELRREVLEQLRWSAERVLAGAKARAGRGDRWQGLSADRLPSVEDMLPEVEVRYETHSDRGTARVRADIPGLGGTPAGAARGVVEDFFAGLRAGDLLCGGRPGLPAGVRPVSRLEVSGSRPVGLDPVGEVRGVFAADYRGDSDPWLEGETLARVRGYAVRWAVRMKEFAVRGEEFPQTRLHVRQKGGTKADGGRLFAAVEGILWEEAERELGEFRRALRGQAGLGQREVTLADLGLGITRAWGPDRSRSEFNFENRVEAASFRIATLAASGYTLEELAALRETPLYTGVGASLRSALTPFDLFRVQRMAAGFADRLYRDGQVDSLLLESKRGAASKRAAPLRWAVVHKVVEAEVRRAFSEFGRRVPSSERVPVDVVMRRYVRSAVAAFEGPESARLRVVPEDAPGSPATLDEHPLDRGGPGPSSRVEELVEDGDKKMGGTDALATYGEGQNLDTDLLNEGQWLDWHALGGLPGQGEAGPAEGMPYEEFPAGEFLAGADDLYGADGFDFMAADGFDWDQWAGPDDPMLSLEELGWDRTGLTPPRGEDSDDAEADADPPPVR
ncbi:hypothetical protein ACFXPA_01140 [Amycolatopsis sp. NPDC059090]|uniref:hypothetical protein n=1 Tax=Amycolatopsis sp. NPDC059090 TaxID=3346723 RepID=UPI003671221D